VPAAKWEGSSNINAPEAMVLQEYVALVSRLPFVEEVRADPGFDSVGI
jgi:hypothetical protein